MKKILNYKKSKKERVFEILEKQGYILDDQTAEIFGNENIYRVHEYIRMWKRLVSDTEFFKNKKILSTKKGYRCHLVEIEKDKYFKVCKEFFKSISNQ